MNIEVVSFGSQKQEESVILRDLILRKPLGLLFSQKDLNQEKDQIHVVATRNNSVVGVLLLKPLSQEEIKMRQVAVSLDLQGQGIGKKLVDFAEKYAKELHYQLISLHAREVSIPFYEKLNYMKVGDPFVEVGIVHYRMEKPLVN